MSPVSTWEKAQVGKNKRETTKEKFKARKWTRKDKSSARAIPEAHLSLASSGSGRQREGWPLHTRLLCPGTNHDVGQKRT